MNHTPHLPLECPAIPGGPKSAHQPLESRALAATAPPTPSTRLAGPNSLRSYQHALADLVVTPGNFIISIPTGMGKTVISWHVVYRLYRALALAKQAPTFLALIVAPTVELCNQHALTIREYADAWGANELIVRNLAAGSGAFYPFFRKTIAVATPGKVVALLADASSGFALDQVQVVVLDEAHNAGKAHVMVGLAMKIRDHNRCIRTEIGGGDVGPGSLLPIKVIGLSATVARIKNTADQPIEHLLARTKELERMLDGAQLIAVNDLFKEDVREDFEQHKNEVTVVKVDYVPALCDPELKQIFSECWKQFLASAIDFGKIDAVGGGELAKRYYDVLKTTMTAPVHLIIDVVARATLSTVEGFVRSVRNKFMELYKSRMLAAIYDDDGIPPDASPAELALQRSASFGTLAILTMKYGPKSTVPFIFNADAPLHLPSDEHTPKLADSMFALLDSHKDTDLMRHVYRLVQSELDLDSSSHPSSVPQERVLIFNTTQEDTLWTAHLINTHFNRPIAAALVGVNVTRSELKRDMPADVIDSAFLDKPVAALRAGHILVLVSTTVAEEGIDVPACSLVVRMDTVASAVQVGQSKGRARQRDGRMVVLCPNRSATAMDGAEGEGEWVPRGMGYEEQRLEDSQRLLREMHNVTQEISRENVEWMMTMRDVCGSDDGSSEASEEQEDMDDALPEHASTVVCWHPKPSLTPRNELETLLRLIGFAGTDFGGVFDESIVSRPLRFKAVVTMVVPEGLRAQLGGEVSIVGQSDWVASKKDAKRSAYDRVLAQVLCPDHALHAEE